ncbi:unnamed protein product, partial [Laminaria digitata]
MTPTSHHRKTAIVNTNGILRPQFFKPETSTRTLRSTDIRHMSAQPPAAGVADHNAEGFQIFEGGEGDGGVAESKGDDPDSAVTAVQTSQAAFMVPDGFKRVGGGE